jgi:large subunit ribosomal protein L24
MKIKKGDNVIVIAGKDKGKKGTVLKAIPTRHMVLIEGLNLRKRHKRGTRATQKGQILDIAHPIHVSNVMAVDPKTEKPTRVGYKIEGGKKVRVARKSGSVFA